MPPRCRNPSVGITMRKAAWSRPSRWPLRDKREANEKAASQFFFVLCVCVCVVFFGGGLGLSCFYWGGSGGGFSFFFLGGGKGGVKRETKRKLAILIFFSFFWLGGGVTPKRDGPVHDF